MLATKAYQATGEGLSTEPHTQMHTIGSYILGLCAHAGMQFYVDNTLGRGKDKELFYADSKVWTNFASYMRSIIYHYNPLTGLSYWQDPTIFAWEPANEPHTR